MKSLKEYFYFALLFTVSIILTQCNTNSKKQNNSKVIEKSNTKTMSIVKKSFGETPEGKKVDLYSLKNNKGISLDIITYGGIITKLTAPDKNGKSKDIVLGYDNLEQYIKSNPYFGALIGRYGNRIANSKFTLDGKEYQLNSNDKTNNLHGGVKGFDKVVWSATDKEFDDKVVLELTYKSPHLEEGFPGNLDTKVIYTLTNNNVLEVDYFATTDKKTIVNLTQHSYFNLSGNFSQDILDHEIMIDADQFIPVNSKLIPTGELKNVKNTPFDFKISKSIGKEIALENEQLKLGGGYDHCWVLNNQDKGMRRVASAYHPTSGRLLEIYSDEPGIQLYSGNFLDGTLPSKQGGTYAHRTGFCLETQHYPDSPNQKNFPSVVLDAGEKYVSKTAFKFSIK